VSEVLKLKATGYARVWRLYEGFVELPVEHQTVTFSADGDQVKVRLKPEGERFTLALAEEDQLREWLLARHQQRVQQL